MSLRALAESAQEVWAALGYPDPYDVLTAGLEAERKRQETEIAVLDRLYKFDYLQILAEYAEALGKEELTTAEKQQAIMNYILKED